MTKEDWIWEEAQRLAIEKHDIELENMPQDLREAMYNMAESNYRALEYDKLVELWE